AVPVLRVEDEQGKLRAVLFGCACHNTTLGPNNYAICGDYAGFAQAAIEEREGCVAMFMIGCGGDANPYPRNTMEAAKQNGKDYFGCRRWGRVVGGGGYGKGGWNWGMGWLGGGGEGGMVGKVKELGEKVGRRRE